jgi:hypothetical protein
MWLSPRSAVDPAVRMALASKRSGQVVPVPVQETLICITQDSYFVKYLGLVSAMLE